MLIRNYETKDLDEVINLFKNTIFEFPTKCALFYTVNYYSTFYKQFNFVENCG